MTEMRSSSADSQKVSEVRNARHTEPAASATAEMGDCESFQIVASQSALDAAPRGVLEGTMLLFTNVNDVGLEQGLKETALALGAELVSFRGVFFSRSPVRRDALLFCSNKQFWCLLLLHADHNICTRFFLPFFNFIRPRTSQVASRMC
jgi:hypothetical protein